MAYDEIMKRTTIYLPEELKAALEARAKHDGRTESEIIREALTEKLRGLGKNASDMQFGIFASSHADTSEHVDEVLSDSGFGL